MKNDDLIIALQLAISQLTLALENISQVKDTSILDLSELTLSMESSTKTSDIVVWQDQAVFLRPQHISINEFITLQVRGRPAALPIRICPTCRGKGRI